MVFKKKIVAVQPYITASMIALALSACSKSSDDAGSGSGNPAPTAEQPKMEPPKTEQPTQQASSDDQDLDSETDEVVTAEPSAPVISVTASPSSEAPLVVVVPSPSPSVRIEPSPSPSPVIVIVASPSPSPVPSASPNPVEKAKATTLLHFAASEGRLDSVLVLIGQGADVNGQDADGMTPLQHAAKAGQVQIVDVLLANGADPSSSASKAESPLIFALRSDLRIAFKLIEAGARTQVVDRFGASALHVFADSTLVLLDGSNKFLVERVLQTLMNGKASLESRDADGFSPLLRCLRFFNANKKPLCDRLIELGASPVAEDENGRTELHRLAGSVLWSKDGAEYLLKKGANIKARTRDGSSILMAYAISNSRREISSADLAYFKSKGMTLLNTKDIDGNTAVHRVVLEQVKTGNLTSEAQLTKIFKAMMGQGVSLYVKNRSGQMALDLAGQAPHAAAALRGLGAR